MLRFIAKFEKNFDSQQDSKILKIMSWNVNGLKRFPERFGGLEKFLKVLKNGKFDICLIQESKCANVNIIEEPAWDYGFECFLESKKDTPGFWGVLTLSKLKPLDVHYGFPYHGHETGRIMCIEFEKFFIINSCNFNVSLILKLLVVGSIIFGKYPYSNSNWRLGKIFHMRLATGACRSPKTIKTQQL